MTFQEIIFPRLNLFVSALLGIIFLYRLKKKYAIFASALFLIVFLPFGDIFISRLILSVSMLGIHGYLLLSTNEPYRFKVSFFLVYFYTAYLFVSLVTVLTKGPEYFVYLLDLIPFLPMVVFIKELTGPERIKISHPIINFLISFSILFPMILILNALIIKAIPVSDMSEQAFYTVIITVTLTISFSVIKPVMRVFSPIYLNTEKELVKYLTKLINMEKRKEIFGYTKKFIEKRLPLEKVSINAPESANARIVLIEKKGRPLFFEEDEFVVKVERELNARLKNIYYLNEVEDKLAQIENLEDELGRIKVYSVLGHMIATVTHQLRNPIAVLKNSMELISGSRLSKKEKDDVLSTVGEEIVHLDEIVSKFLEFARTREFSMDEYDIKPIIIDVVEKKHYDQNRISIKGKDIRVRTNRSALEEILAILIQNALEATDDPHGGQVEIIIKKDRLTVSDNGSPLGLAKKDLFQPFVTTKAKGIGLGLSIVKKLSELLKMRVEFVQKGKWKHFTMRWNSE